MAVPTFHEFFDPLLRVLAEAHEPVRTAHVYEKVAERVGLTAEDRAQVIPSGGATYKSRIGWAQQWLKHAGYTEKARRGYWTLSAEGRSFVAEHPRTLSESEAKEIIRRAHALSADALGSRDSDAPVVPLPAQGANLEAPEERIGVAIAEIRARTAAELLEAVTAASPQFFERLVLELLHALGYGGSHDDLQVVGGSGDGGIDGIISLDKLGFEKVYVQAKRWQNPVGAPEIQGFFGALAGRRARKGVFITTSSFTRQAREFWQTVSDTIVLVDGARLAELMMDHGVGVTAQKLIVPKIDRDYFDEDD